MDKQRIGCGFGVAMLAIALTGCSQKVETAAEKPVAEAQDLVKEKEAKGAGVDAYIYAYPLVTMEMTRRSQTNVVAPEGSKAPMGAISRLRGYPAVDDHAVTAPNADTLYTQLWLDVSKEPWIISVPDMHGRFYLLPMLDGWTTVFADPASAQRGRAHKNSRLPVQVGAEHCLQGSLSTNQSPASSGCWAASTARARRRITRRCTRFRTRCLRCRFLPTGRRTWRRRG